MCPDDAQLSAFLDGALEAAEVEALTAHLAGCHACRHLVTLGARVVTSPASPSMERYVLLRELGAGSMGVVFAAWDKRLDRRVALKMLHPDSEDARQERLEREARALARLSHPNVVAVYDVGRSDDGLYVAMEYVDGQTLRQWLLGRPDAAAVVEVFRAAGAGLLAAHDAGLVHRDFKPDNVLIGNDGRARVSDFGLAHVGGDARPPAAPPPGVMHLTHSGVALGTPAYMSPEALRAGVVNARSDQFSFCVSLWEALTGRRPFAGRSVDELLASIAQARLTPPASLGRQVEQTLRRGLRADPAQRFPSMKELLEALEPRRSRPWLAVAALTVAAAGFAVVLAPRADACAGSATLMRAVWSPARADTLRAALTSAGLAPSAAPLERLVEAWARGWVDARTAACQATQRKEQSEGLLDQRMQCFDAQLKEAQALLDGLTGGDAALAARALDAVSSLPGPGACAGDRVSQRVPLPADRTRLGHLTDELARLKALAHAGRFADAAAGASTLAADARALGYAPLAAAALVLEGTMLERTNEFERSNGVLVQALAEASRGRDDEQAVAALTQLAYVAGFRRSNLQQGLEWVTLARALIERLRGAPRLEADLEASHSIILREAGKLGDALDHEQRRATLLATLGPPGALGLAQSMVRRGRILSDLGRYQEARALLDEAARSQRELLGPAHPDLAATLNPLSMACRRSGDLDGALRAGEEALAIGSASMGPESLEVGYTLNHLGNVYAVRGEWRRAVEVFTRVLRIGEKHLGPEHHEVGMAHANLCWALRWQRRWDEAGVECERAEALVVPRLGPAHHYSVEVQRLRAMLLRGRGAPAEALALEQQLLSAVEAARGAKHPQLAEVLAGIGLSSLALGKRAEAAAALERATGLTLGNATKAEQGEVLLGLGLAKGDCALLSEGRQALEAGGASPAEWASAAAAFERCAGRR
ncbi:MAG: protein kinase [Myxococcaceae bacterium]|nr:protein kinase [Myxococcaceae bacterium]